MTPTTETPTTEIQHTPTYRLGGAFYGVPEDFRLIPYYPSSDPEGASKQANALWAELQARAMINRAANNAGVGSDDWKTMTHAAEYLEAKIRRMLHEEPWLMTYMVAYATQYVLAEGMWSIDRK